jgi:hypothetical protein
MSNVYDINTSVVYRNDYQRYNLDKINNVFQRLFSITIPKGEHADRPLDHLYIVLTISGFCSADKRL